MFLSCSLSYCPWRQRKWDEQIDIHTYTHISFNMWSEVSKRTFTGSALWWGFVPGLVGRERLGCGKPAMLSSHRLTLWKTWLPLRSQAAGRAVRIRMQFWPLKDLERVTGRLYLRFFECSHLKNTFPRPWALFPPYPRPRHYKSKALSWMRSACFRKLEGREKMLL